MFTKTDICNLALSNIGETVFIDDLDTDNNKAASVCRRFYDIARKGTLSDFNWSFARKVKALSILTGESDDVFEFIYKYPNDCLTPRYIETDLLKDLSENGSVFNEAEIGLNDVYKPVFQLGLTDDNTQRTVMSNTESAKLVYTMDQTNTDLFPAYFVDALAFKIAAYIAMPMTGSPEVSQTMLSTYQLYITQGAAVDLNGQQSPQSPQSEQVSLRIS